jgi:D-beta-D-heptose 7-phosphate kinase/D-beta-D-heptose 1-phosphate adenosyltransferase
MKELPDFSGIRILVVGDVMLDRYWHGPTNRISPEAPVPVVRVDDEEGRPGGAGNVALNISALGGRAILIGLTGDDEMSRVLEQVLHEHNVDCRFERLERFPTITKLRIISRNQQLIRLDFEDGFPGLDDEEMMEQFKSQLPSSDLVLLSDYNKGTLRRTSEFISLARAAGKPVLVDPKGDDFKRYQGATLITPNMAEFEAVVGSCADDAELVQRGYALMDECRFETLLITRGERGMTLLERNREPRHIPTHAQEVFDVTGAGDTVIAALATAVAAGMPIEAATQLANVAAGVVVGKLGTASATLDEIRLALSMQEVVHRGVVEERELITAVEVARSRGESIVFTNGCFDILHAGHVTYLEQASRLGDRLVVAVNVDATVRQLKGDDRPVNTLEQRMLVLAALGCVDWVVPFSEETPERLICELQPDFLVKGGDTDPDKIPGADCVRRAGGEVRLMDHVAGCSTTDTISDIRGK